MSTYHQLRRLFTELSLAALATQAMGCDDSISRAGFEAIACEPAGLLSEAAFRSEADYLAIRRIALFSDLTVDPNQVPMVEGATGVPCAGAPDQTACQTALAALPLTPGFGNMEWVYTGDFSQRQLVWTRGAETGVITNVAELRELLGTIETPEQAALLASFSGSRLTCGGPNANTVEDGFLLITSSGVACGRGTSRSEHLVLVTPSGEITVERSVVVERGDSNCVIGRLTDGVAGPQRTPHTDLGSYFAEMARLEATAVLAFERLERELSALGAPAALVARAHSAARDEARHTDMVNALAAAFGGDHAEAPVAPAWPTRSALDLALENAAEGCVRETYGALVATYQAASAEDPRVRAALTRIAADETEHAAFSWDLGAWLDQQLTSAEQAQVLARRAHAIEAFEAPYDNGLPASASALLGLPDVATRDLLFRALHQSVWSDTGAAQQPVTRA